MVVRVNRMVLAPQHEWSARQRLQLLLSADTLQISLVLCEQTSAQKGGGMSPAFIAASVRLTLCGLFIMAPRFPLRSRRLLIRGESCRGSVVTPAPEGGGRGRGSARGPQRPTRADY